MCRMLVVDGNFKAELLRPKKPEADVALTAGEGYVTEKEKYAKHVAEGKDFPQVSVSEKKILNKILFKILYRNLHVTIIKPLMIVTLIGKI
jgi:hypothetical protein